MEADRPTYSACEMLAQVHHTYTCYFTGGPRPLMVFWVRAQYMRWRCRAVGQLQRHLQGPRSLALTGPGGCRLDNLARQEALPGTGMGQVAIELPCPELSCHQTWAQSRTRNPMSVSQVLAMSARRIRPRRHDREAICSD